MKASMDTLMIKISTKLRKDCKWHHQTINQTPYLDYDFGSEGYWRGTDRRISGKGTEVAKFTNTYWQQESPYPQCQDTRTNLWLYQDDLESEIQLAIERVNGRWQEKFKRDFELHFEDDLVKFLNSGERMEAE